MHETGHSKPVLWDNPEGWNGEGGGRGVWDGETHVWQKPLQYCKVMSPIIINTLIKKKKDRLRVEGWKKILKQMLTKNKHIFLNIDISGLGDNAVSQQIYCITLRIISHKHQRTVICFFSLFSKETHSGICKMSEIIRQNCTIPL